MLVGPQKYVDEVKADTLLRDVMRGMSVLPDSRPSYRQSLVRLFACIPTLIPTNELCILSCFLALLIVDGRSDWPLGTWCVYSVC